MGFLKRRLDRLEARSGHAPETPQERGERRRRIREAAEHANACEAVRGGSPIFELAAANAPRGGVFCASDGRPVTTWRQTGAERSYRAEMAWTALALVDGSEPRLTLDETGAFVTLDGLFALDRDRQDLPALAGPRAQELEEGLCPERWRRFLEADEEAAELLDGLLGLAEEAAVPDGFATSLNVEATAAEAEDFPGTMKPTALFSDAEEREQTRRLTWALIHDAEARAALGELTLLRDAFVAEEGWEDLSE